MQQMQLNYMRGGPDEGVRAIYPALRDRSWNTIRAEVMMKESRIEEAAFDLTFDAHWRDGPIDFSGHFKLSGTAEGCITYSFSGTAHSDFERNRIGFSILHGAGFAGRPVDVTHTDGSREQLCFPVAVSPSQPVFNIRDLAYQLSSGFRIRIRFSGDTFEMEDQRNWSDASFKTYCTPLEKPFPVAVRTGEKIEQVVTLFLDGPTGTGQEVSMKSEPVRISPCPDKPFYPRPSLGIEKPKEETASYSAREIESLRRIRPGHLRVEIPLADPPLEENLLAGVTLTRELDTQLELAVFPGTEDEEEVLSSVLRILKEGNVVVRHWLLVDGRQAVPPGEWIRRTALAIRTSGLGGRVAAGTNGNYAELNRNSPDLAEVDGVCFSINPQVHAFDDASLMETLEMHGLLCSDARKFGDQPICIVSPITLTPRFNATSAFGSPVTRYEEAADPRQGTDFAAIWSAGSILNAWAGGAEGLTYFKTRGSTGIMDVDADAMTETFPVHEILRWFGWLEATGLRAMHSTEARRVGGFEVKEGGNFMYLLLNYTGEPREIFVKTSPSGFAADSVACIFPSGRAIETCTEPTPDGLRLVVPGRSLTALRQSTPHAL